jgi:hypothetical protein
MAKSEAATPALISTLHEAVASRGLRTIARDSGVHHTTIKRALSGAHVNVDALVRLSRIAPKVRTADEFSGALKSAVSAPVRNQSGCSWTLESIRSARDCQMNGDFQLPVRLAEALRTDDALYTAYHNRIAPLNCLASALDTCGGARGEAVRRRALASAFVSRSVLAGIDGTLANHGVAIGYIEQEVNDDGTQVDFRLTEWPLEFVRYDQSRDVLTTKVRNGGAPVDIVHGNGRWIIFRKFNVRPWNQEAALLPASFVWAAHAEGLGDWAGASRSHGLAKVMGELPEGYALADKDGNLTDQARAYLQVLGDLMNGNAAAGIRPFGAKSDFLANGSTAWQVFAELILDRKKAAAAIYQGTDATLGAAGGAPGVDIATLFGVATTKVQGDITAIEDALYSGFYVPWTAINCGDSRYAPRMKYQIPDPDAAAKAEENAGNRKRLHETIAVMKEQGFRLTQDDVNALAAEHGVHPAPVLATA